MEELHEQEHEEFKDVEVTWSGLTAYMKLRNPSTRFIFLDR